MDGPVAHEQGGDVGYVPQNRKSKGDVLPRQVCKTGIEVVVFGVGVGVRRGRGSVAAAGLVVDTRYHGPCRGAYADDGKEDGEEAEDHFPEKSGIVGVHCGARRARHGRGISTLDTGKV